MRREGQICGKTTNKRTTRATGKPRCRIGCASGCNHSLPAVNKSVVKTKGHLKRTAWDITINHHLDNWRVCTEVTYDSEADLNASSGIWGTASADQTTLELLTNHPDIGSDSVEAEVDYDYEHHLQNGEMGSDSVEAEADYDYEHHDQSATSDQSAGTEVDDPELQDVQDEDSTAGAEGLYSDGVTEEISETELVPDFETFGLHGSFQSFKSVKITESPSCKIESASCKLQASVALSEDSWSGIELSDDDDDDDDDDDGSDTSWDDWSLVDEDLVLV